MYDVAIVGAGPAGTSCALWLKQLGFKPLLIDKNDQCGGLQLSNPYTNTWVVTSADAWGKDVAQAMHANMVKHKVSMRLGCEAISADTGTGHVAVKLSSGESIEARFLVLSSGVTAKTGGFTSRLGMLVGPGPAVANTRFSGASVAILGGGDSAFENHLLALERGAKAVTIFARTIRARSEMLEKVPGSDVVVGEYVVDDQAMTVNGERFDHILVLYGYEANAGACLGLDLAMRPDGFVSTADDCLTSNSLVYAIGELARRAHPCCVTSMADGVVASKAIQKRLEATTLARYSGMVRRATALGSKALSK